MSIQKPVSATIRADDFRDGAYTFTIQSVLSPEKTPGMVVVTAPVGYLLTTPLATGRAKREYLFRHNQQPDGSWAVAVALTLVISSDTPANGVVVIRDSSGDTVVLTIDMTNASLAPVLPAALTVSQSALSFTGATPEKPVFQVLTLAQRYSDQPVTLTTDAPGHFQLASDSQPGFASSLTFIPLPTGSHVHVRYVASRQGTHTGQLTIRNAHETRTVELTGRCRGLLPVVMSTPRPSTGLWAGLLALLVAGGLTYGYSNRCQLFPALCFDAAANGTINETTPTTPGVSVPALTERPTTTEAIAAGPVPAASTKPGRPTRQKSARTPADRLAGQPANGENSETPAVAPVRSIARSLDRRPPANQDADKATGEQSRRRVTPASSAEESDLERELNQTTRNQL